MKKLLYIPEYLFFFIYFLTLTPITLILSMNATLMGRLFPASNGKVSRKSIIPWGRLCIKWNFGWVTQIDQPSFIHEPHIVICNHQSETDIFIAQGYFPIDFVFFSKKEVFENPVLGMAMRACKHIPIDRENKIHAAKGLLMSRDRLKEGISVLFYPEATYSDDADNMLEFQPGAFHIAQKTGAPIFPIVIHGAQQLMHQERKFRRRWGRVRIKYLDRIDKNHAMHPANIQGKEAMKKLCADYREWMMKEYHAIKKKA